MWNQIPNHCEDKRGGGGGYTTNRDVKIWRKGNKICASNHASLYAKGNVLQPTYPLDQTSSSTKLYNLNF